MAVELPDCGKTRVDILSDLQIGAAWDAIRRDADALLTSTISTHPAFNPPRPPPPPPPPAAAPAAAPAHVPSLPKPSVFRQRCVSLIFKMAVIVLAGLLLPHLPRMYVGSISLGKHAIVSILPMLYIGTVAFCKQVIVSSIWFVLVMIPTAMSLFLLSTMFIAVPLAALGAGIALVLF